MMGSYELRDLDHIGVGYLYEGKLVIDKTWGHGYYGCAGCCGYEGQRLLPNPLGGGVGTQAGNTAESEERVGGEEAANALIGLIALTKDSNLEVSSTARFWLPQLGQAAKDSSLGERIRKAPERQ